MLDLQHFWCFPGLYFMGSRYLLQQHCHISVQVKGSRGRGHLSFQLTFHQLTLSHMPTLSPIIVQRGRYFYHWFMVWTKHPFFLGMGNAPPSKMTVTPPLPEYLGFLWAGVQMDEDVVGQTPVSVPCLALPVPEASWRRASSSFFFFPLFLVHLCIFSN